MTNIKAVVFDLDGTLINTLKDIALSCNKVLADNGYPVHPVDAYRTMVGDGAITLVERALPKEARKAETIKRLYAIFRKEYADRKHKSTEAYPGIPELLKNLKDKNIKMAILSNKPDFIVSESVSPFLPLSYFDIVMGHKDGKNPKPDPWGLVHILSAWGLAASPERVCMIGDSDVDIFTAKAAGVVSIGAGWGFRGIAELKKAGADYIASSPYDVISFFE